MVNCAIFSTRIIHLSNVFYKSSRTTFQWIHTQAITKNTELVKSITVTRPCGRCKMVG